MFASATLTPDDAELAMLPARELSELVRDLERQRRRSEAALARVVAVAERVDAHRADAHASVSGWLRALTKCSSADASGMVRLAHVQHEHPAIVEALEDGCIGVAHAREIARLAAHPRCGAELAGHLAELLLHAKQVGLDEFRLLTRRWKMLADADGPNPDPSAGRDARNASLDEVGDRYVLRAGCDRSTGVELGEILARYVEEVLQRYLAATGGAPGVALPRTPTQRRFDALERIFHDAVAVDPDATDPEALVNLVIDITTLERLVNDESAPSAEAGDEYGVEPTDRDTQTLDDIELNDDSVVDTAEPVGDDSPSDGSLSGDVETNGSEWPDDGPDDDGPDNDGRSRSRAVGAARVLRSLRSETVDGRLTDPMAVVKAMLWGRIRWIVTNRLGEITAYSTRQRLFTGTKREIVLLHAQHCIWPGCPIPGSRCQADHLHDHQHGGTTSLDNGAPLCRKHNDHKSRHEYQITRDTNGYWHTHRADGTEV